MLLKVSRAIARAVAPILVLLAFLLVAPAYAARQALVIGNDNYTQISKLQKAGNDATAMARELKAAGFAVQLHLDLSFRSMVRVVEAFTAGIKGGDEVVVFFAGHGVQFKAGPYLLPTDIEASTEGEVQQTAYELNLLTEKLSSAKPAFALVIVDACRNNPLKAKGNDRSLGETRGLSVIEPPKGQMVVFSASKGQRALDRLSDKDANPNSVFTREFIARMKRPGVRIQDLMEEVRDAVEALAGTIQHEQRPSLTNEARGNFYFFGPTKVQVAQIKPEPIESSAQIEQQGWAAAQSGNTEAGYAAYLREYPQGRYAAAARIVLASMQGKAAADKAAGDKQAADKIVADKAAAALAGIKLAPVQPAQFSSPKPAPTTPVLPANVPVTMPPVAAPPTANPMPPQARVVNASEVLPIFLSIYGNLNATAIAPGVFKLVRSDNTLSRIVKGGLVLKNTDLGYIFNSAETVSGSGTFGYSGIFRFENKKWENFYIDSNAEVRQSRGHIIKTDGDTFAEYTKGANFEGFMVWQRVSDENVLDKDVIRVISQTKKNNEELYRKIFLQK